MNMQVVTAEESFFFFFPPSIIIDVSVLKGGTSFEATQLLLFEFGGNVG